MRRHDFLQGLVVLGALAAVDSIAVRATALEQTPDEKAARDRPGEESRPDDGTHAEKPVWLDGGVGWQRMDLTTFYVQRVADSNSLTADLAPHAVQGLAANVGLGVRFYLLTLGARLGMTAFDNASAEGTDGSMQLYSIDAELGFRIPISRVEPYLVLGAGYSVLGGLGDAFAGLGRGLEIDGANARLGLGIDYFMSSNVSIGIRGTAEVLFLARRGVPLRDLAAFESVETVGQAKERALEGGGSSIGSVFSITVGPGLHF